MGCRRAKMRKEPPRNHPDHGERVPATGTASRAVVPLEILIAVVLVVLVGAIAVREYAATDTLADIARVRKDMYSLATAMEAYFVDNNSYPACTSDLGFGAASQSIYASLVGEGPSLAGVRTFRIRTPHSSTLMTLTTPIAYIPSYPPDPFADTQGATYMYFSAFPAGGWILGSWGPDTDQATGGQLKWNAGTLYSRISDVEIVYEPAVPQPSSYLLAARSFGGNGSGAYTYDPTNGVVSTGDLWRVRFDERLAPKDTVGLFIH